MAVSNIVQSIMRDNSAIIPVAHVLDESFGPWAGVAISLPCRIGWEGINQTLRVPMDFFEKSKMDESVNTLKEFAKELGLL